MPFLLLRNKLASLQRYYFSYQVQWSELDRIQLLALLGLGITSFLVLYSASNQHLPPI